MRNLWLSAALFAVAGCVMQPLAPVAEAPPPAPVATVAYPAGVPDFVALLLPAIPLPPGRLTLSNYSFPLADVEAVITPYPDCALHPGIVPVDFKIPLNGTWVIPAAPGSDVCWRRSLPPTAAAPKPVWTPWNRDYTGTGRAIDSRL